MKSFVSKSLLVFALVAGVVTFVLCSACREQSGDNPVEPPPGRAEETWRFWKAFNEGRISGTGVEVLKDAEVTQDVEAAQLCVVLEDIIAGEKTRSHTITSLAVLHVDPDLTSYAVKLAGLHREIADTLQDYVLLLKKQEQMTSGPVLGVGLLLNLLNHSDDREDGILWRAILDEGRQTSSDLQALKEPTREVEQKLIAIRNAISESDTEEFALRVKLSQRFGREFPPNVGKMKAVRPIPARLSKEQIIQSLIGKKAGNLLDMWTFENPKEFISMQILAVTNRNDELAAYDVAAHVKKIRSGLERNLKLRLTYRRLYTRWVLQEMREFQ